MENCNVYGYEFVKDYKYTIFGHSAKEQKTINDFFILKRFVDLNWVNNRISRKLWKESWKLHPNNEKMRLNWFSKKIKKEAKLKRENGNTSILIKYPQKLDKLMIKSHNQEKLFRFEDGSKFELDFVMPKSKEIIEFEDSNFSKDNIEVSINEFLYTEEKEIILTKDGYYKRPTVWGHIYLLNKKGKRDHGSKIVVKIPLKQIKELLIKLTRISNSLNLDNIARLEALEISEEFVPVEIEVMNLATKAINKKKTKSSSNKIKDKQKENLTFSQLLEKEWNKAWENKKKGILNDFSQCYCVGRGLLDVDIGNHFPDCPKYQNSNN